MIVSLYPGRPFQSIIIPLWGICWQSYDMCIVSLKFKRCFNVSTPMNYEASRLVSLTLLKLSRLINFEVSRLAIFDLSLLWILSSGSVAGSGVTVGGPRVPHVRVPWTSKHPLNIHTFPKQPQLLLFSPPNMIWWQKYTPHLENLWQVPSQWKYIHWNMNGSKR